MMKIDLDRIDPIKVYIAAPIVGVSDEMTEEINQVKDILQKQVDLEIYDPKQHGVPNAWGLSMGEWARCIFALDVVAIDNSDWVVVCDYGRKGTAGTAWEAGYAFGKGKKVLIIEMAPEKSDYSVMIRGCSSNYVTKEYLFTMNKEELIDRLFVERGRMLQKEILN